MAQLLTATSFFGAPLYAYAILFRIKSFLRQKINFYNLTWQYLALCYFLCHGLIFSGSLFANKTALFSLFFVFISFNLIQSCRDYKKRALAAYTTVLIFSVLFCLYGTYEALLGPLGFPDFFYPLRNNSAFVTAYDTPDATRQFIRGGWQSGVGIRANGFYSEPSHAAPLILAILAGIHFAKTVKLKLILFIIVVFYSGLSFSRTNWLILIIGLGLLYLPPALRKSFIILTAVSGLVGLIVMQDFVSDFDLSILERLSSTYSGLTIWIGNPIFGIGTAELKLKINEMTFGTTSHTSLIHSGQVAILASTGLVGLILIYGNLLNLVKQIKITNPKIFWLIITITLISHFFYQIIYFSSFYIVVSALIINVSHSTKKE